MREPGRNTSLQAVNGRCLRCSYRLVWIVIRGRKSPPSVSSIGHAEKGSLIDY